MEIVVNEWLLDYSCPNADPKNLSFVNQFIKVIEEKGNKVVVGRGAPFFIKFYRYWDKYRWDNDCHKRFKKLNDLFFIDKDKTIIVEKTEIKTIPNDVENKTPPDDKYLIELAYSTNDKIIVTTDTILKESLKDVSELKVYLLEEFIKSIYK